MDDDRDLRPGEPEPDEPPDELDIEPPDEQPTTDEPEE